MPVSVRQSILWTIAAIFLIGNFVLVAVLWRHTANQTLCLAATGALVAEPMLLATWLGFARQPIKQRLLIAIGLSSAGAIAYVSGLLLVDPSLSLAVYTLFPVAGIGSTLLAGGFFRAHRFLAGVLTTVGDDEPIAHASSPREVAAHAIAAHEMAEPTSALATTAHVPEPSKRQEPAHPIDMPAASPFDDDSPSTADAAYRSPTSRELQFSVGYIIAMTSGIAILLSMLRWLATTTDVPSWSIIFLFGWTYFVYSVLATLLIVLSILTVRYRPALVAVTLLYTLLAPLATIPIIQAGGVQVSNVGQMANVYAYTLSLTATLALVIFVWQRLGYRLRHGRL